MQKLLLLSFLFIGTLNAQSRFVEGGFMDCDSISINDSKPAIDLTDLDIDKIELVSFDYVFLKYNKKVYTPHGSQQVIPKGLFKWRRNKYKDIIDFKIEKLSVDSNYVKESVIVDNQSEINTILTSIKNNYVSKYWSGGSMLCYSPRNAIVFKNKDDKIEFIIELCFECRNCVLVGQGIDPRDRRIGICRTTIDYIYNLFKTKGVKHGID